MIKPKVFIASSTEKKAVMTAVNNLLSGVAKVTMWTTGSDFKDASGFLLDSLSDAANKYDFVIAIFGGEDKIESRKVKQKAPRDNVIFELGLFMSRLKRQRSFVIVPKNQKIKILSDLYSLNVLEYIDPGNKTKNLEPHLRDVCKSIKTKIAELGCLIPQMGPKGVTEIDNDVKVILQRAQSAKKKIKVQNIGLDMEVTWPIIKDNILEDGNVKNISWRILMIDGNSEEIKNVDSGSLSCSRALTIEKEVQAYFKENEDSLKKRKIDFEFKAYSKLPTIHGFLFNDNLLLFSICSLKNGKLSGARNSYVKYEINKQTNSNEATKHFLDAFGAWTNYLWKTSRNIWPLK